VAAVSADYARRLQEKVGVDLHRMTTLYPGVELPAPDDPPPPFEWLTAAMPNLRRDIPIVAYFGRQDPEKGIDLLLYAARMLQDRGHRFQLVVCGGASFGRHYHHACRADGPAPAARGLLATPHPRPGARGALCP
jgi:glycosyltransferase involved in cell wall biosynthesis